MMFSRTARLLAVATRTAARRTSSSYQQQFRSLSSASTTSSLPVFTAPSPELGTLGAFSDLSARALHASAPSASAGALPPRQRPDPTNNAETPFDFSPEKYAEAKRIMAKYPPQYKKSAVIPLLDLAQQQEGWVPLAAMNKIAKILEIPRMDVYEVVTFYTMFNRQKMARHHIQVCTTTPCMLRDSASIMEACKKHLGIKVGESTADGLFHLSEVECLGACVNAPMVEVTTAGRDVPFSDVFYEDLTPETMVKVLDQLREGNGKIPPPGVQSGRRVGCEPEGGLTSLTEPPTGPFAPYLDKLDAEAKQ